VIFLRKRPAIMVIDSAKETGGYMTPRRCVWRLNATFLSRRIRPRFDIDNGPEPALVAFRQLR